MEIAVLLEPIAGNGYRATSLELERCVAEAPTREEALEQLRHLVSTHLARGELVRLKIPAANQPHPWRIFFGKLKHHPDAAEVEQNIREYRRQVDQDPDRL